ncbi:hypothetical protein [Castellaniella sp. UC4442_H9]
MSVAAVHWAFSQKADRSTSKFVLVALANVVRRDDPDWEIYASVEYLVCATSLNRKTVLEALRRLREAGLIIDTGRFAGINQCSPVYRLRGAGQAAQSEVPAMQPQAAAAPSADEPPLGLRAATNAGSPGKRLPGTWTLPAHWLAWTREQRPEWPQAKIDSIAAIFHAHWTSANGPNAAKPDWFAAWRLWVLREREAAPDPGMSEDPEQGPDYGTIGAQLRTFIESQQRAAPPSPSP